MAVSPSAVVSVSIDATAKALSRPGFSTALLAAYHTHYSDRVRVYTSTDGMVSDGFAVTDPAVVAVGKMFAQKPAIASVKVGRRALPYTQTVKLTCLSANEGDVYELEIGPVGSETAIAYTVGASATTTTVATAIELLVEAVTDVASTSSVADITAVVTAGKLLNFKVLTPNLMALADITADPGIATDLAAIKQADGDFYGLLLDSNSLAEITAAAAWAETNKKLFAWNTADTPAVTSGTTTTNIAHVLKTASYKQSPGLFSRADGLLSYAAAARVSRLFAKNPGRATWAYKSLAGISIDTLTDAEFAAAEAKNLSTYQELLGVGSVMGGKVPVGEWIDIVHGDAWLESEIQVDVIALFLNNDKVSYDDDGIALVEGAVRAKLLEATGPAFKLLAVLPAPEVSVPKASEVSQTDKANRALRNVFFTATHAGAIHFATIEGSVTF